MLHKTQIVCYSCSSDSGMSPQSSLTVRSNIPRSNILVTAHKHISLALYHHLSLKHLSNKLGVLQSPCRTVQEQISIYSTR